MNEKLFLSVILPAYNEEERLGPTLAKINEYLDNKEWSYEIIVVDDGSTDHTVGVVEKAIEENDKIRLIKNPQNMGKGFSVRNGMLNAKGEYRLFTDSDLSTPIGELDKLLYKLRAGADIAIGSRNVEGSDVRTKQPFYRVFMGRVFNVLVQIIYGTSLKDTQCGFKLFTKTAAETIFPKQTIWRFGFDVEIIFLGEKLGYKVAEVPVIWINSDDSRVSAINDSISMFIDLIRIRCRLRKI